MSVEEYFGMIISILIGLTFIALFLAFLYIMYGEKEEGTTPSKARFFKKILELYLLYSPRLEVTL